VQPPKLLPLVAVYRPSHHGASETMTVVAPGVVTMVVWVDAAGAVV